MIAPGLDGAGAMLVDGRFVLFGGRFFTPGILEIEIGGSEAGVDHDLLTVLGTSILDGIVMLELIAPVGATDLFAPTLGDAFDVLVATEIVLPGSLELVTPALPAGLGWLAEVVSTGDFEALRFLVVPEPGAGSLLALGLVLLAAGRRHCSPMFFSGWDGSAASMNRT